MTRAKHDGRGFGGRGPPAHDSPTPVLSLRCSCLDLLRVGYVSFGPAANRPAAGQGRRRILLRSRRAPSLRKGPSPSNNGWIVLHEPFVSFGGTAARYRFRFHLNVLHH